MTVSELQVLIGSPYIVGTANPFVLGQFYLTESGMLGNHINEGSAEQVIAWVERDRAKRIR